MHTSLKTTVLALLLIGAGQLLGCSSTTADGSNTSSSRKPQGKVSSEKQAKALGWSIEGRRLKGQGFSYQALSAFNRAVDENPMLTQAHLSIGNIYREIEAFDKAESAYRNAVLSDPNNFDARYYLGLNNHLQGKIAKAIASYQRALVIDPSSYIANRDMGSAMLQAGRPTDALKYAKQAVKLNPESQSGWANLAAAYSLTKDYRRAVEAYRQTLELGEPATPVLLGLADAHIQLGHFQRAENALRAIKDSDQNPIASERLAVVLFKQRKLDQAAEAYRAVLDANPNDTASLNGMGVTLMAIYLRDGEEDEKIRVEALTCWRRSMSIRPDQEILIDLISRYTKE